MFSPACDRGGTSAPSPRLVEQMSQPPKKNPPKPPPKTKGGPGQLGAPHDVSPAEEAARAADPGALTNEEKAKLAAEVSRIEDA